MIIIAKWSYDLFSFYIFFSNKRLFELRLSTQGIGKMETTTNNQDGKFVWPIVITYKTTSPCFTLPKFSKKMFYVPNT